MSTARQEKQPISYSTGCSSNTEILGNEFFAEAVGNQIESENKHEDRGDYGPGEVELLYGENHIPANKKADHLKGLIYFFVMLPIVNGDCQEQYLSFEDLQSFFDQGQLQLYERVGQISKQNKEQDHRLFSNQNHENQSNISQPSKKSSKQLHNFYQFLKIALIKIAKSIYSQGWSKLKYTDIANKKKKSRKDCQMFLNHNQFKQFFIQAYIHKQLYRRVVLSSTTPQIKQEYLNNLPRIKLKQVRGGQCFHITRKKRSDAHPLQ